jgi:hypothetical protein
VRNLLEAFLDEESDTLSPAEAKAIAEADEWSKYNEPIPHEQVLAEFGLSMADHGDYIKIERVLDRKEAYR